MTDNMLDLFLLSIIGGGVGCVVVMWFFYYHFKSVYVEYKKASDKLHVNVNLKSMEHDLATIKIQVKALFGEFYHAEQDHRDN